MRVVHFCGDGDFDIDLIQAEEFVYLERLECKTDATKNKFEEFLFELSRKTSRLYLFWDLVSLPNGNDLDFISWVGIPIEVGNRSSKVRQRRDTIFSNVSEEACERFEAARALVNEKKNKLIPEFIVSLELNYVLGPTLAYFFSEYNLPFAFIRVNSAPDVKTIEVLREAFEYLRIRNFKKNIYFSFSFKGWQEWSLKTFNTFSGLRYVHIDLSNKCTHSCSFCGLWSNDAIDEIKNRGGGQIREESKIFLNNQLPYEKAMSILESLPETVHQVQFGGAGDPLTHPKWLDIITKFRARGFHLEVLSNFEYPEKKEIDYIHSLSRESEAMKFYVNISASTASTYTLVRPRQSEETFKKVISNLMYLKELKERDGFGVEIILVNVINSQNYHEVIEMVELAKKLNAILWLKPLEIHSELHKKYMIKKKEMAEFQNLMAKAISKVVMLNVRVMHMKYMEAIAFGRSE